MYKPRDYIKSVIYTNTLAQQKIYKIKFYNIGPWPQESSRSLILGESQDLLSPRSFLGRNPCSAMITVQAKNPAKAQKQNYKKVFWEKTLECLSVTRTYLKRSNFEGAMTLSIMTLSLMTLSIMTLSLMTLSIITLSIMILSIMTLCTNDSQHNNTLY